ncbi:MAG: SDR family NAD(P)-dependent oxidoreductase [Deltaproteobacteria bacterium]|nr:SDR family NAD(P)-dependent oxidoreductase [Deltaproteobacteria bacterium]
MKSLIWQALEGARLIQGKVALISGAAAGIGKACARMFAKQGASLALVDLKGEDLEQVSQEIQTLGLAAIAIQADITRTQDVDRIFKRVLEKYGRLDILVNNAGGGLPTDFFAITMEEWNRIVGLNLTSVFACSQKAAAIFKTQGGGVIVNLSSQAGRSVSPTAGCHYTASKAGVLGLTRHLAKILGPDNIRVNAVCPGITNSERLMQRVREKGTEEQMKKSNPLGRIGDVDEIASCCLFLASELSSYVNGAALDANCGSLMV